MQRHDRRTTRFYLRDLASQHALQRLLHGKVSIGGIARALTARVLRRAAAAGDPMLALLQRQETRVGRVRRKVRDLHQRNVPILFVLSGNDPGLVEIAEYFGAQGRQFRRQSNVMFRMLEGADHTLSAHWAREALLGHDRHVPAPALQPDHRRRRNGACPGTRGARRISRHGLPSAGDRRPPLRQASSRLTPGHRCLEDSLP